MRLEINHPYDNGIKGYWINGIYYKYEFLVTHSTHYGKNAIKQLSRAIKEKQSRIEYLEQFELKDTKQLERLHVLLEQYIRDLANCEKNIQRFARLRPYQKHAIEMKISGILNDNYKGEG